MLDNICNWLIKRLGGFTLHEMQELDLKLNDCKMMRLKEREEYIVRLERYTDALTISNKPAPEIPVVNSAPIEPLALSPMPWTRLRRQLETADAVRFQKQHEKT